MTYIVSFTDKNGCPTGVTEHSYSNARAAAKRFLQSKYGKVTITAEEMQPYKSIRVATQLWQEEYPSGERKPIMTRYWHGLGHIPVTQWLEVVGKMKI